MALFLKQKEKAVTIVVPIDVFILGNSSILPVISCRPIGVLLTGDQGGIDPKVIAVPLAKIDPAFSAIL
jgi:inorganic pyrophosphatase